MIGRLRGRVAAREAEVITLEAGGIGWELICPLAFAESLEVGEEVLVFSELQVLEGEMRLYGFPSARARALYRKLRGVQGVGARSALALLSTLGEVGLRHALAAGDLARLERAPGIGRKTASRLAGELGPACAEVLQNEGGVVLQGEGALALQGERVPATPSEVAARGAALSALLRLGYPRGAAEGALAAVASANTFNGYAEAPAENWVREALALLAR